MSTDDNPRRPVCKKCLAPPEKGLFGTLHDMCLLCIRASHGVPRSPSQGTTENTLDENSPESDHVEQSEAVEPVAGFDHETSTRKDINEDKEGTGNKGAGATVSSMENGEKKLADGPKRRGRPAGAKSSDGVKLTPACAKCKRAKVRCTHRRALGDTPADFDVEGQGALPPPKKRKTVRIQSDHADANEQADATSGLPPPSKQQTRGTRKRKVAETEDVPIGNIHASETSQQPSQKRSRRGRKPKSAQPMEINDSSDTVQGPLAESLPAASNVGTAAPPSFPADSLEGAALLSRHVVLSRELQQKLEDCDAKWLAAIESLKEAKRTLDAWVSAWRTGQ